MRIPPLVFIAVLASGLGHSAHALGLGSASSPLLADPLACRPLGMAGNAAALSGDLGCLNQNPAGLSGLGEARLALGHGAGLMGAGQEYGALGVPLGALGVLGAQVSYFYDRDVRRDDWGNEGDGFTNSNLLASVAFAREALPGWRAGVSAKMLREEYAGEASTAVCGDLGLQGALPAGFTLGLAALNLGGGGAGGADLPSRVNLGLARALVGPWWMAAAQAESLPAEGQLRLGAGTELSLPLPDIAGRAGSFRLRAGIKAGVALPEDTATALGAGVALRDLLEFDYAALPGPLGVAHRASLTLVFPALAAPVPDGAALAAPFGLYVTEQGDGIVLWWEDANERVRGYNVYSDYGVLIERLNAQPVRSGMQRFIQVTRSRVYNFYVRPIGGDGREGPASRILTYRSR